MFALRSHIRALAHSHVGRQDKKDRKKKEPRLLFRVAAEFVVKPVSRLGHRSQDARLKKNKTRQQRGAATFCLHFCVPKAAF